MAGKGRKAKGEVLISCDGPRRRRDALMTGPLEFLNCIMQQAIYIYSRGLFQGDNDRDFFVIKGKNGFKAVWLVRNEHNKLTAMLKEDY